ncbi:MAG TPA: hypothetical protein VLC98_09620 [Phnomibacter sp.]|nr:hypothetical protein [Phnomibacter sp.]
MAKKISAKTSIEQLQKKSHKVNHAQAIKMAKRYQKFVKELNAAAESGGTVPASLPVFSNSISFNKKGIQKLLKEPTAVGFRIYPAINDNKELTTVLVAFDAEGNNITYASALATPKKASKAKGTLKAGDEEEPDEGVLDDGQLEPPVNAPKLP